MQSKGKKSAFNEHDLVMYLATGLKHLRLMVLLVCVALVGGMVFYIYSRSVYYSKSLIRYHSFARPVDSEAVWKDSNERVIIGALKAPHVIERTARRLGIANSSPRALAAKNIKKLRLRRDSENNIVVEVYAYSYPLVRDWTQTMLKEYLAHRDERRLEYAETAIRSFTEDMAQMKDRMDKHFDQKFDFKEKNELDKLMIELTELREIPHELFIIKHRLGVMDRIRDDLQDKNRDTVAKLALLDSLETDLSTFYAQHVQNKDLEIKVGQTIPVPWQKDTTGAVPEFVVLPSSTAPLTPHPWEGFDKEQRQIKQEMAFKARTFLPGHPQMVALRKQSDRVRHALDMEFEVAYNTFNLEYANLLDKQAQFEKKLPDYEEITRRHEKLLKEYSQLDSGQIAWSTLYNGMAKKLTVLDFGFDKDRIEFEYGGTLEMKDKPISPHRSKLILYSLVIGMALAIAIAFLLEYVNSRVTDMEQAEETLSIRGLGVVPKITDVPFESLLLSEGDDKDKAEYHLKENFRLIRTNLVMNSENGALPQVILITSAMPQEGKTVVAANLALSFAAKGEKTLLIDGDLRRGRMYKLFALPNKPGLSNLLSNEATLDQVCRPNGHENLTIMTCGRHINSASELLDGPAFPKLLEDLRGKYNRIILDTPPVLGLSETLIMQRVVDGVLLVIWSEFTPIGNVKQAVQSMQTNGAKFCGFVLNRLDFSAMSNRYKYFYYAPLYYSNYKPLPAPMGAELA